MSTVLFLIHCVIFLLILKIKLSVKTVILYSCKPLQSIIRFNAEKNRINSGNELITSEMTTPISMYWQDYLK